MVAGPQEGVEMVKGKMREWYEVKVRAGLGREAGDDKDIVVIGRIVRWTREGVELAADAKHGRKIRKEPGVVPGSSGVVSLVQRAEVGRGSSKYRAVAARANYLGVGRPDLQFAVKEACPGMAAPSEA